MEREFNSLDSNVDVLGHPVLPKSTDISVVEQGTDKTTGDGTSISRSEGEKDGRESKVDCNGSQSSSEYEYELLETQPTAFDPHNFRLRRRLKRKMGDKVRSDGDDEGKSAPPKRFVSVSAQDGNKPEKEPEYDSDTLRRYVEHCAHVDNDPETELMKLTIEEFLCQTEVDENEFGSSENLHSIFIDSLNSPYSNEDQKKRWKLRHNRFVEVMKRREEREQEQCVKGGDLKTN